MDRPGVRAHVHDLARGIAIAIAISIAIADRGDWSTACGANTNS
jgi:hypothetical protein